MDVGRRATIVDVAREAAVSMKTVSRVFNDAPNGRMSGASGKVSAAIHVTPEALGGRPLAKLRDSDFVRLCGQSGELSVTAAEFEAREPSIAPPAHPGTGRELFAFMRNGADTAEAGASAMLAAMETAGD